MGFHSYFRVEPDSQFYDDLAQIKTSIQNWWNPILAVDNRREHVLKGLDNTIARGYKLTKQDSRAKFIIGSRVMIDLPDVVGYEDGEVVAVTYTKAGVFYDVLTDSAELSTSVPEGKLQELVK